MQEKTVKTVFYVTEKGSVKEEQYSVPATGQQAAEVISKQFPDAQIVLAGFLIDEKFVPAEIKY